MNKKLLLQPCSSSSWNVFKTFAVVLLSFLVLAVSNVCAECTCDPPEEGDHNKKEALKYKIVAFVSILVAGAIGVALPQLGKKIPAIRPEKDIFFVIKAFAAGVILATAFIHILPDAFESLSSPCLKENPWANFPFTGFIAMMSAILTLMVDTLATGYYRRSNFKNTQGAIMDHNQGQDDHVHNYATHAHSHGSASAMESSEANASSELMRHRVISQAWIYDHFPVLKLAGENPGWCKGTPRGTKYIFEDNRSRTKEQHLIRMREILDQLKASDVCFDPYKEDRASGHINFRSDLSIYFGPLWHPTGYVMYNPSRVMRQHGYIQQQPLEKMGDYYKLELELCSSSGDNLTIVHTGPPTVLDNWDKRNDFIIDTGRRTNRGDGISPDYMSWYNKVSHPLVIREIKSNTTAAGSSYNCIIKDKPAGYDRLVNRFKRVSKMLIACLKSGDPMPAKKIKEARDLVDNMDNEDYAAQFGEKVTKRHQPKVAVSKTGKRTRASSSAEAAPTEAAPTEGAQTEGAQTRGRAGLGGSHGRKVKKSR